MVELIELEENEIVVQKDCYLCQHMELRQGEEPGVWKMFCLEKEEICPLNHCEGFDLWIELEEVSD